MSVTKVLLQAEALMPNERKELLKLLHDLVAMEEKKPKRSLFEIRGKGKGIWQGVDVKAYIDELRDEGDRVRLTSTLHCGPRSNICSCRLLTTAAA